MSKTTITTDYLVIGAGINGLAFVDELLTRTTTDIITIVDQRDAPGGHWNDAYPYVKLHQPSTFYGVESTELSDFHLDQNGLNKGFLSLATKPEITAYCQNLVRNRFLPSGRVTYLPMTEYMQNGQLRHLLSGKLTIVDIRKKLVNAAIHTNSIPLTHQHPFSVHPDVTCLPPNDLPLQAKHFNHFTVVGGGKTGIDACIWLLTNGTPPDRISWIIPNDYWYVNRAKVQPIPKFFLDNFSTLADLRGAMAAATDPTDLALRYEKCGLFLRLDPSILPTQYHAANISPLELSQLQRIPHIIRKGYLKSITPTTLTFTSSNASTPPITSLPVDPSQKTLYIDTTASALPFLPPNSPPTFTPKTITLHILRYPQIPFSASLIAFLESCPHLPSDADKNAFARPVRFGSSLDDWVLALRDDGRNREAVARDEMVKEWCAGSRTEGFARVVGEVMRGALSGDHGEDGKSGGVGSGETVDRKEVMRVLERFRRGGRGAREGLERLCRGIEGKARL